MARITQKKESKSKVRVCIEYTTAEKTKRDILKIEEELVKLVTKNGYEWKGTTFNGLHGTSGDKNPTTMREAYFAPLNGNYKVDSELEMRVGAINGIRVLGMYSYIPLWQSEESRRLTH